jgi:S1-C subfamily serine protease
MIDAIVALVCVLQDPDAVAARKSQQNRTAMVASVAPAVCSVMDISSGGGGSGVIIDPHGFVLTNYHVVGEADTAQPKPRPKPGEKPPEEPPPVLPPPPPPPAEVLGKWDSDHPGATAAERQGFVDEWQAAWRDEHLPKGKHHYRNKKVGLPDGELYEAVVLGIDPGSDLALLRLLPKTPGQTWPFARLGDSDDLLVGETVLAMGNPFLLATDFTPTVTFGIVSGTHRYQEGGGQRMLVYPDCIQVDAPVNPGNSGGPLFNERGEVVGINGRISIGDRGRVNVGVGFAIASNQIANFLPDLMAGRHAEHGTLDMSAWYMTAPREETKRRGVFVQQTYKDSVAAAAGVSLGDEITSFNGNEVRSANQLATMVGVLPAGAWVSLGYRPAGEGGYGAERTVVLPLSALDTGSSADAKVDAARLASRENRRIASAALLQRFGWTGADAAGGRLTFTTPEGWKVRCTRQGDRLRLELDKTVLVGDRDAVARWNGDATVDASVEEKARLQRELAANPFLHHGDGLRQQLTGALLLGGVQVQGRPAYRFGLPGDGELEAWFFADGTPAGYAMRDPLRKARVEWYVSGGTVRVVADGKQEEGWKVEGPELGAQDETLVRRQS